MTRLAGGILLGVLLAVPAAAQVAVDNPPPGLQRLADKASALRGLPFIEPLQFGRFEDGESLQAYLQEEFERAYPEAILGPMNRAYQLLGLADEGEEVTGKMMDMMLSQIGGLYDPRTKQFYVVWDLSPDLYMVQAIFIHEIVHALQDQHFDLLSLPIEARYDDDRAAASMALVEGDATYSMMLHAPDTFDPLSLSAELLLTSIFSSGGGGKVPHFLQKQALFAYLSGRRFVEQVVNPGKSGIPDWEALNRVFADPPQSTEQILHPAKYLLEPRDVPVPVSVPDATAALGEGWRLTWHNELGELGIGALFETELRLRDASRASEGWGGDRYGLWEHAESGGAVLVWDTRWDTEPDAVEFYEALARWGAKTGGGEAADLLKGETIRQGPYRDRERIQFRDGDRVVLLDGEGTLIRRVLQAVRAAGDNPAD